MFTNQSVKEYVEKNPRLVTRRPSIRYPGLYVLKYAKKVFYDKLWTEMLEDMRGTVVDENYNPIVMPFRKIYNRGERGADIPRDEEVLAIRKVNGFMAAATYVEDLNRIIVTTTGSTDSKYVELAEKWINPLVQDVILRESRGYTYLFEIVDRTDPHVVHEDEGAYLIGMRQVKWDSDSFTDFNKERILDHIASSMEVMRPHFFQQRFSNLVHDVRSDRHEGYVVYGKTQVLKIKTPHYLITKFLGRMSYDKVVSGLSEPMKLKERIDEEFYPLIDYLVSIKNAFCVMDEQTRFTTVKEYLNNENAPIRLGLTSAP